MMFTRNVNKQLSLSFGSYPISVERRGRMLDADWIWAGADGARNGARRPNCVRRHDSPQRFAQSRAASDHMLKAYVTRALLGGGGGVWTPPSGFSRLAKIRRRAAPPDFHPPYPPSFPQLLWKFRPNAMWGQVTRSGQVTQLQNNFPIAPRLQCFRESYESL